MRSAAFAVLGLISTVAVASEPDHVVQGTNIACADAQVQERIIELASSGDRDGAGDYARLGIASGVCVFFHDGDRVFLDDYQDHMAKVHRSGDLHSYWMNGEKVGY